VGITLGIIGGIAPPSTVDYYRGLIAGYRERRPDAYPSIVINSIDLTRLLRLVEDGQMAQLVDYLGAEIERLARAGAGCALLAANTPHVVFDELRARSPVPLLSIVEAAAEAAAEQGLHDLASLGTRFTMQGTFYPEVFARWGMAVRAPGEQDLAYVHEKYVAELIPCLRNPGRRAAGDRAAGRGGSGRGVAGRHRTAAAPERR
jgi:aspartate racemase